VNGADKTETEAIRPSDVSSGCPPRLDELVRTERSEPDKASAAAPVPIWRKALREVWTTTKPRATGLGLSCGAGDENRTRALSLGITGALVVSSLVGAGWVFGAGGSAMPHLTVADRKMPLCVVRKWCGGRALDLSVRSVSRIGPFGWHDAERSDAEAGRGAGGRTLFAGRYTVPVGNLSLWSVSVKLVQSGLARWETCRSRRLLPSPLRGWTSWPCTTGSRWSAPRAPAGMDPSWPAGQRPASSAPRACGDGPSAPGPRPCLAFCSPRLRGWTHGGRRRPRRYLLLPAPAGMDPPGTRRGSAAFAAPRACGDGPGPQGGRAPVQVCSSRLRGWTRERSPRPRARPLLPALAGMYSALGWTLIGATATAVVSVG
jgi:hypothetical protein